MKTLKKKELEDYKNQLVKLQKDLTKETHKDLKEGMGLTRDDLKDIDDFAQNENDVDIWAISNNQKHEMLVKIQNALERIHNKTFGLCELCSQAISEPRLKAIPYAGLCIKCQEKEEEVRQTKKETPAYLHQNEEFSSEEVEEGGADTEKEEEENLE